MRLGVNKIRLTGGEPILRRGLTMLVELLAAIPGFLDFGLTTNGLLLADQARAEHLHGGDPGFRRERVRVAEGWLDLV